MFKNYSKSFWRSLIKNKTYSFLNIVGLSAGLTCFTLIALWVSDELSYDKFNTNFDRIYRVVLTENTQTGIKQSAVTGAPIAKALLNDYPEVKDAVRLRMREEIVTYQNQQVLQPGILLTDPSFFNVFSYHLTKGDVISALKEPYSIILTESTAKKYFGDKNPMGQSLLLNMYDTTGYGAYYTVTGIMPDPPTNAHFTFKMLASFKTIELARPDALSVDGWGDGSYYTYLLLKEGVDYKVFSQKMAHFYEKYIGDLTQIWKPIYSYHLQPLSDIHLRSELENEITPTGSMTQVYIFSTVAIFILLIAGINYTNLATARSLGRAKEVNIKKVVGAYKKQLVLQYLFEAIFTSLLALVFSVVFSSLLQPFFYQVTGKDLSLLSSPVLLLLLIGIAVLLGIISGIYPAFILSSFRPAAVLKGAFISSTKGVLLRKTLVVIQFVISIVLATGIIVINSQMSFIKNKDLGYNKDGLLFIRVNGNTDVVKGYTAFQNELKKSPLIWGAATSNSMIIGGLGTGGSETIDSKGNPIQVNTSRLKVDSNFFTVYQIKLIAGRNFTGHNSNDSLRQIIVNEKAVKKFGWENNQAAIGKPFRMGDTKGVIVGVTNDFHFNSLEQAIEPLAITQLYGGFSRISLNVNIKQAGKAVAFIENTWKRHFPSALFDYDFLSQEIKQQYLSEERFSRIFLYFSVLSLLIACLGLYGLISYTIFQKTKEIGIRKILGASASQITVMLSGNFLQLVFLASLISIPAAWYIMSKWLENFAYRINLSWWLFTSACLIVLLIALLTISVQSVKAAISNPAKSLRTE
ncbi:MAG: ABC transporter permease [Flavisolibacter sp.]